MRATHIDPSTKNTPPNTLERPAGITEKIFQAYKTDQTRQAATWHARQIRRSAIHPDRPFVEWPLQANLRLAKQELGLPTTAAPAAKKSWFAWLSDPCEPQPHSAQVKSDLQDLQKKMI